MDVGIDTNLVEFEKFEYVFHKSFLVLVPLAVLNKPCFNINLFTRVSVIVLASLLEFGFAKTYIMSMSCIDGM